MATYVNINVEIKSFLVTSRQISFTFYSLHVHSRVAFHLDSTRISSMLRSVSHVMMVNICTFFGPGELMCLCRELIQHQKLSFTSITNQICREKTLKKKKPLIYNQIQGVNSLDVLLKIFFWSFFLYLLPTEEMNKRKET